MKYFFGILLVSLVACNPSGGPIHSMDMYPVIPQPASISPGSGVFPIVDNTSLVTSNPEDPEIIAVAEYLREEMNLPLPSANESSENSILLTLDLADKPAESYELTVGTDQIEIKAPSTAGLFYGVQTLLQILPDSLHHGVPVVDITDQPQFSYRGMHLDVGRHFFPVSFIRKYLDLMAMYKMNTFHWHLTEDQGWRIEIRKYPRLTEVGAYRPETVLEKNFDPYVGDGIPHGGFYTQEEIREIVQYAAERHITVIPEIELPGHSTAALAAYPEFACTEGPFEVARRWGVMDDIYCPKEETFAFLEDVLTEVIDLFPGKYIHIGGDEAPKKRWIDSDLAQEVIQREGLADEHELQSYFIKRIEKFLTANNRQLIGWDEILEGGLAPEATVMSWRGVAGGIEAARQGHDVIMTPTTYCYFDYYQGDPATEPLAIGGNLPLEKVYEFNPIPEELTAEESSFILGAQGNVWTEYIKTEAQVEYMVLPRMLALSEVVWSPDASRNWESFLGRMGPHLRRLQRAGYHMRVPTVNELETDVLVLENPVSIALSSPVKDAVIRYTVDGSEPDLSSPVYTEPFSLTVDSVGTIVSARVFLAEGLSSPLRKAVYRFAVPEQAAQVDSGTLGPGLSYDYFEETVGWVWELEKLRPVSSGTVSQIQFPPGVRETSFGLRFTGFIDIPQTGVYRFFLTSDDGSRLDINGKTVIDHDGYHAPSEKSGEVALEKGVHYVTVLYTQAGGGKALELAVRPPGGERDSVPETWWYHELQLASN